MKTYFQISLKVFTVLLTVMLVCVGCGKNGNSTSGSGILGGMSKEDMCNPAKRFTEYKPIYELSHNVFHLEDTIYNLKSIQIFDANGEVKYSDEEAEEYYSNYAAHFLFAYKIAQMANKLYFGSKEELYYHKKFGWKKPTIAPTEAYEIKSYVDEHLFDIVCNLPLNNSYPSEVREIANKIYYDYKDEALNIRYGDRGYGYISCIYDVSDNGDVYYVKMFREEKTGAFMAAL